MSQTFKKSFDKGGLFYLLEKLCVKKDKYYIYDLTSYKRGELTNDNTIFIELLKPYYHKAKLFYLNRKITYSGMCTIIRQICKLHSIMFTTKIVYSKSKYNIPYYIYF